MAFAPAILYTISLFRTAKAFEQICAANVTVLLYSPRFFIKQKIILILLTIILAAANAVLHY
jgi:hypothetical protein